jgi:hypothetical protein
MHIEKKKDLHNAIAPILFGCHTNHKDGMKWCGLV